MQKCESCSSQFSWSKIYKSFWWAYKPIECGNCGVKHRITILGRFTFVALTMIPMLTFMYFLTPFNNIIATIGTGSIILIIGSLFTPYVVQYENSP
ncbi:TIGR04104 family putative zinc finger protein [Virgibacillus profundi]|uniref:TIGR04104 family putative zinc finger protein n=1 Tax=Virgibacillus profundi TaxID=2024555 RepID=UPI0013FE12DD|nr:TIGR04104 family putative zinc finger protein [Virgibacillus profundi]